MSRLATTPGFNAIWLGSSGVLPDSACPAWTMGVGDSLPTLTGGAMRIHTTAFSHNTYFQQSAGDLVIPDTLVVEARLRYQDGRDFVGPCGHYREAAGVAINTGGSMGTLFFVGDNEIFITNGGNADVQSRFERQRGCACECI